MKEVCIRNLKSIAYEKRGSIAKCVFITIDFLIVYFIVNIWEVPHPVVLTDYSWPLCSEGHAVRGLYYLYYPYITSPTYSVEFLVMTMLIKWLTESLKSQPSAKLGLADSFSHSFLGNAGSGQKVWGLVWFLRNLPNSGSTVSFLLLSLCLSLETDRGLGGAESISSTLQMFSLHSIHSRPSMWLHRHWMIETFVSSFLCRVLQKQCSRAPGATPSEWYPI